MCIVRKFKKAPIKKDYKVLIDRGDEFADMGEFKEAIKIFNEVLKINNKDFMIWVKKGKALKALGKDDKALKCYIEASILNPISQLIMNNLRTII